MGDCIIPDDYPELRLICWHRPREWPMSDEDAWMLYKSNWRYVYQEHLTEDEKRLIERLTKKYGSW